MLLRKKHRNCTLMMNLVCCSVSMHVCLIFQSVMCQVNSDTVSHDGGVSLFLSPRLSMSQQQLTSGNDGCTDVCPIQ